MKEEMGKQEDRNIYIYIYIGSKIRKEET